MEIDGSPDHRGSGRVALHDSIEISAPAQQVWELICDWAGMSRWWLPAEEGGLQGPQLISCELVGAPGSVPRTRRMVLSDGGVVEETIFYQNDETRRIHYIKADNQHVVGYVATTYVDDLADGGCVVHIASTFDATQPDASSAAAAWFADIYRSMFAGYSRYFTRQSAH
ncbi:SRPBCC family protein [Nocardia sp. NPDC005998]|uniref:SRPBCC family protein n=1 Tax=Nocardia sp. NPDC005998 TaxID=3156894 RepID=UPI0033AD9B9F